MRRLLLLLVLALAGCAPRPPLTDEYPARWREHAEAVKAWRAWELQGRVALQMGEEGWHARLHWSQHDGRYRILLSGPFGQGGIRLEGDERQVLLRQGDRVSRAGSAEGLMRRELGWSLPVEGLRSWVLGLPADRAAARPAFDTDGQLAQLRESGWTLEYGRYEAQADGVSLPTRLQLENGDLRVKLVVDRWQRLTPGGSGDG